MQESEVLKAPDQSVTGSQTKKNKANSLTSYIEPNLPTQKATVIKPLSRVFILEGGKVNGTHTIMAVEDVVDPATGNQRRARLLRGAQSIWMDEQKNFDQVKGYVEKNTLALVFQKGRLEVSPVDKLKNQFLDVSNRNIENPNRLGIMKEYFKEWNSIKIASSELQREEMEFEAMGIASSASIDEIIPHAQYLGVDFIDPISGHPLTEKGIRTSYMRKAKADPKKFLDSIHSPVVQMSHKIRRAIDAGKIDLGKLAGQAYFVDGGFITAIPKDRQAIEYLTEFAQASGEANQQFVYQLENLIQ